MLYVLRDILKKNNRICIIGAIFCIVVGIVCVKLSLAWEDCGDFVECTNSSCVGYKKEKFVWVLEQGTLGYCGLCRTKYSLNEPCKDNYDTVAMVEKKKKLEMMIDSFPLWGNTWMIGKGNNKLIYTTVSPTNPTHLVKVTLPTREEARSGRSGNFIFQWATFTDSLFYMSSTHLLNDAIKQFKENELIVPVSVWFDGMLNGRDTAFSFSRQTIKDTIWSVDSLLAEKGVETGGTRFIYGETKMNVYDSILDEMRVEYLHDTILWDGNRALRENWLWFNEKPLAWIETSFELSKDRFPVKQEISVDMDKPITMATDPETGLNVAQFDAVRNFEKEFIIPTADTIYYKSEVTFDNYPEHRDYCRKGVCYEYFEADHYQIPDFEFWTMHIFPVVKLYPRNAAGNKMMRDYLAMGMREARENVKWSIKYMNFRSEMLLPFKDKDGNWVIELKDTTGYGDDVYSMIRPLQNYRKPYLSDSASVMISVQFKEGEFWQNNVPEIIKISLSLKDGTNGEYDNFNDFEVARKPDRIIKVGRYGFYDDYAVEQAILRLYVENEYEDSLVRGVDSRCRDNWKQTDVDVAEKYRFEMLDTTYTNPEDPSDIRLIRPVSYTSLQGGINKNILFFDSTYTDRRFFYNDCPCLPIQTLNGVTASQLREIIFKMPPVCEINSMINAMYVLQRSMEYLVKEYEVKMLLGRIAMLGFALEKKMELYINKKFTPQMISRSTMNCPQTWELNFRDTLTQWPLYAGQSFDEDSPMFQNYKLVTDLYTDPELVFLWQYQWKPLPIFN